MTASLDWSQCPTVESIPGKVSGAWENAVSLNLHLFESPIRRQSRVAQFSCLYEDAKRTVLQLFRASFDFYIEDIALFALADSDLPRQLLPGG